MSFVLSQGSVVVLYNWLQREQLSPHTWVTDYMNDLSLPVNFVGLSTQDRRFIYPMKEVSLIPFFSPSFLNPALTGLVVWLQHGYWLILNPAVHAA